MKNIGIYVTGAKWPPYKDSIVSGHVQIPLKTASLLLERGYEVTLNTTEAPDDYRIPPIVPLRGLNIKTITKATRDWPRKGFDVLKAIKQFLELRYMLRKNRYDILHFFGAENTAYLLGLLKATGIQSRSIMTFTNFRSSSAANLKMRRVVGQIDQFVTSTDYTRACVAKAGLRPVKTIRPGLLKTFSCADKRRIQISPEADSIVLSWRNANEQNGADTCLEAFQCLSADFPRTDFVFAVRPHDQLEEILKQTADKYHNIHLLLHPYPHGMTISDLVCSASCVVMPFRSLTMNPQFAVLETLSAGVPLITTPVESNAELIEDGETGYLVPPSDIGETCSRVRFVLEHLSEVKAVGSKAINHVNEVWNWGSYIQNLEEIYAKLTPERG